MVDMLDDELVWVSLSFQELVLLAAHLLEVVVMYLLVELLVAGDL